MHPNAVARRQLNAPLPAEVQQEQKRIKNMKELMDPMSQGGSILNGMSSNSVSQGHCPSVADNVFRKPIVSNNDINNSMHLRGVLEEQKLEN